MAYELTDIVFDIPAKVTGTGGEPVILTAADKAVLNVLAHRADRTTFQCHPGYGDIADHAAVSRRQAMYSIYKLTYLGVFSSVLTGGDDSPYGSNLYVLDLDRLREMAILSKPNRKKTRKLNGETYTKKQLTLADLYELRHNVSQKKDFYVCKGCGHREHLLDDFCVHVEDAHPDAWADVKPKFDIENEPDELELNNEDEADATDEAPETVKPKGDGWTPVDGTNLVRCPHCSFTMDESKKLEHMLAQHHERWKAQFEHWDANLEAAASDFYGNDPPISLKSGERCEVCNQSGCRGGCDDDIS